MTPRSFTRTLLLLLAGTFCARAQNATGDIGTLETARAVRVLMPAQAGESRRVLLSGIVLGLAEPQGESLVLRDASDSIYVTASIQTIDGLAPGDTIEVRGRTAAGDFAPFVRAESIRKTGTATLPEPAHVSSEDLFTKGVDAQWIEVSGIVRGFAPAPPQAEPGALASASLAPRAVHLRSSLSIIMTLAIGDRLVPVQYYDRVDAERYIDAEVEIRGLCFNLHNAERQFLKPLILVPRGVEIRILRPPPAGPFALPTIASSSLFQFQPDGLSTHRVHVDGVVLHQQIGTGIWIRDHGYGLFARTEQRIPLAPGDVVQVAGFPERGEFAPMLAHAIYRKIGHESAPPPVPLRRLGEEALHDNDLVTAEGALMERKVTKQGLALRLQSRGSDVDILCNGPETVWNNASLEVGSGLSVAGICLLSSEHALPPSGVLMPDKYSLLVRGPADIVVLRPAPWWTLQRVSVLLAAVVAILSAFLVAGVVVSRRKLARERALRAIEVSAYSARLAERSRMARDLHDTVAQGLTAISLQLEVAVKPEATITDVGTHVGVARDLVRSSMKEVRSFIRNLRTQTQQDVDLGSALEELLHTAVEGSTIRAPFVVEGSVRKLAPEVEGQIIRVTQEAVLNAVQHSEASEVSIALRYAAKGLEVTVTDNGQGFDPTATSRGERLHFGLVGMKERAAQIGSTLTIHSDPRRGTRVVLEVPYDAVLSDNPSL